jgi:hypothetical protein
MFNGPTLSALGIMSELRRLFAENRLLSQVNPYGTYREKSDTGTSLAPIGWVCYRCSIVVDSLRAGRSGDRTPLGARYSAVAKTWPQTHPASCTMGTGSLSLSLKISENGVYHPPPTSAEVKERVALYYYSSPGHLWPVTGRTLP